MEGRREIKYKDRLHVIRRIIKRLYQADITTAGGIDEVVIVDDNDSVIDLAGVCHLIALYSDIPKDKVFYDLIKSIEKRDWRSKKVS